MAWQQIVTGTAAELEAANPVLEVNQLAVVTEVVDNVSIAPRDAKLGDGVTRYNSLPTWMSGVLTSYLDTTVTYNATAVLADTALSVTVAAAGKYAINLVVHSTNAVKGLLMDFGGTATMTSFVGNYVWQGAADGATWGSAIVSSAGTDFGPAFADGADGTYTFTGSCTVNAGGTFLLRGCQNVSDASNTTILAGSTLVLTRIA